MSKIRVNYLSDEALSTIKANIPYITEQMVKDEIDKTWIKKLVPKNSYVQKKFEIEEFTLKTPKDQNDKKTDIENSIILYEHLKELPMYVLTDERFWCWINFEKGYAAAQKYMPIASGKSVFKDHWLFTGGNRRGIFFGVLSRCFFRVYFTVDQSLPDPYEYSRFVIEKPERFRNFTWRTYSSDKNIVMGAIKAEKQIVEKYKVQEKTEYYTNIAKLISQLGSAMILDAMSESDIEKFVYERYEAMIKNNSAAL